MSETLHDFKKISDHLRECPKCGMRISINHPDYVTFFTSYCTREIIEGLIVEMEAKG